MQSLWAPWRMQYILADKTAQGCIFCLKPQEADDTRNHVLLRGRTCYAMLNIYPYSNGHLMVVPYKHTPDLDDLAEAELADLIGMVRQCQRVLHIALKPEGYNIGVNIGEAAGAGIKEHLHIHVVPRWKGDSNFMSVTADTRVVPESLDETLRKLKQALARV